MGLSIKQRVKVNAALSMIYSQGYDAQTVVAWAKQYVGMGHSDAQAYSMALNEFAAGQPDLGNSLGKITRLVEASDVRTVAQYDAALSKYIATGDSAAIDALAPMMARDAVALAVKNGELPDGTLTGEAIEAALGFAVADDLATQAATPAAQPNASPAAPQATDKQTSPFGAGGYVADQGKQAGIGWTGGLGSRGLLAGRRNGDNGMSDTPAPVFKSKAEIRANYANQGASIPSDGN